ncbi:MAG: sulfatase-like hydrolase/transferase [Planctomycetota bacterium]
MTRVFSASRAAAVLAAAFFFAAHAVAQPNIVLIISDDAGWADFGFNDQGNGLVPTPEIDRIADGGRWFRAAYTAPVCSPSRARMFLGLHNQRTGYDNNGPNSFDASDSVVQGLMLGDVTMFERLKAAGYSTGFFGKWHLGQERDVVSNNTTVIEGNLPPRHGIDYFLGLTSGSRPYFTGTAGNYQQRLRELTLDPQTNLISDIERENSYPAGTYMTDLLADEVADYITKRHDETEPFFVTLSFTAPHGPLQATNADLAAADALGLGLTGNRRTYTAMMIAMDRGVGTVLDRLEDPDNNGDTSDSIADNTIVVFINDNGGETANSARNFPLRGKKSDTFDGGIRVVMAMRGPGVPATGASFNDPVDSVDLVPTFLAAANAPLGPMDQTDGVNLLPYLDGTISTPPHPEIFVRGNNPLAAGARVDRWKLTSENIGGPFLYDIVANPGETNVLTSQFPGIAQQLREVFNSFETEYMKPRWGVASADPFDRFIYKGAGGAFSMQNAWTGPGGSPANATLDDRDGYANLALEFPVTGSAYNTSNDIARPDGLEMIANEITFTGNHISPAAAGITVGGLPLLLSDTLDGTLPSITQNATSTGGGDHPVEIAVPLVVWDDLAIGGGGDQPLVFTGDISQARSGRVISQQYTDLRVRSNVSVASVDLIDGLTTIEQDGLIETSVSVAAGARLDLGGSDARTDPNYLGNSSALMIETPIGGPAVALNFDGREVIGSLAIDGNDLPRGIYGASTHPDVFSGDGQLILRGPLLDCPGDINDDGYADVFDALRFIAAIAAAADCGGGNGPALPGGISVNTVASDDTPGDGLWDVSSPGTDFSRPWSFSASLDPVQVTDGPGGIVSAYEFPAAAANGPDYEDPSRSSSTVEIWFDPANLSGNKLLFEAGGGARGIALWLSGSQLRFDIQNGTPSPVRASTTITDGWHQVVASIDINAGTARLYVDGQLRDTISIGTDRWSGANPSGLGQVTGTAVGSITPPNFAGRVAIYRHYNGVALDDALALQAFQAVANASAPCDAELDLNNDNALDGGDITELLNRLENCVN